jgi:hypothetical protein
MPVPSRAWIPWLLVAACVPVHLSLMDASLWTDEAWVADSVMAPSVGQMLYYKDWVQSTPSLVLLAMRGSFALLGASELAFRVVPLIAGLLSLLATSILLHRTFPLPVALLGTTFQGLNYWAFKYAQQSKQYSMDLLVSSGFLLLLWSAVEPSATSRRFHALLAFGCVATFASHPAVFWYPAAILTLALDHRCERRIQRALVAAGLWGSAVIVNYFAFVLPNSAKEMFRSWSSDMLLAHGLGSGLIELANSLRTLLIPPMAPVLDWVSALLLLVVGVGLTLGIKKVRNGRMEAVAVLGGGLSILTAVVASMAGLYPVLGYPRVMIWCLPSLIVLMCLGLRALPVWNRMPGIGVAVVCIAAALASPWMVGQVRATEEENRAAFTYVETHAAAADWIYVHGGLWAQFEAYEQILDWSPTRVYIGAWGWPCCALDIESKASDPAARTAAADVANVSELADGRIWAITPAGLDGHWSGVIRERLEQVRDEFALVGCVVAESREFGHTRAEAFDCR